MKQFLSGSLIIALFAMMFYSCDKESNDQQLPQAEIEFAFSAGQSKSLNGQGLANVVVTIEDLQGNVVKNSEKIEIYNMNGYYISKPISLVTGDYKLSSFLVLDATNNVVYASPVEGSAKAYLVEEPLPIEFTAQKDVVTKLSPEVLSTAESHPEDFGYATFSFEIAETFDFLVGAVAYNSTNQNFQLTTASISIYNGSALIYTGKLEANTSVAPVNYDTLGITNKITLPEKYNTYTLKISKAGYGTYNKTFTKEELRLYYREEDKGPLVVILDANTVISGLVAYYPFDRDFNDYSGNSLHASNSGSVFSFDRFNSENSALAFDGVNDYVTLPSDFDLLEKTICLWFYAIDFPVFDYINYPKTSWNSIITCDHPNLTHGSLNLSVSKINGINKVWIYMGGMGMPINPDLLAVPVQESTWYNVIITFSAQDVKFYLNGNLIGSYDRVFLNSGEGNPNMMVGTTRLPNGRYLDGGIDELRIYNRVLTEQEIQILYNE